MIDLQPGDQIEIAFADPPGSSARATVTRLLSDREEGLSVETEDYAFCWLEIAPQHQDASSQAQVILFAADWKYYLDGREVKLRIAK